MSLNISGRQEQILRAIVDAFISVGEPVGSRALCESGINYSSATIRNEMSELSELGFLDQPHTSAGRIPSGRGLRYYVDNIMDKKVLTAEETAAIDAMLGELARDPVEILNDVSAVLAELTKLAALSATVADGDALIKRIEVIPTGKRTVLILLITDSGVVKNKHGKADVDLNSGLVTILAKILNERLANLPVSSVTPEFIRSFTVSLGEFAFVFSAILLAVLEAAREAGEAEITLEGQNNLLFRPEFDGNEIRELIGFLSRKKELNRIISRHDTQSKVLIGRETEQKELYHSAMVTARYRVGGKTAGTIGIIGPQRMDYAKIISSIEYFASSISEMLTEVYEEQV